MTLPYVPHDPKEDRKLYLARVMVAYLREYDGEGTIVFDNAECDGNCLADDIEAAFGFEHNPDSFITKKQLKELQS